MPSHAANSRRSNGPPLKITDQEERIAALIACGKSQRQISSEIKVDRNVVRRLLDAEWFRAFVASLRRCGAYTALGNASEGLNDAVASLRLESTNAERSADRIRASAELASVYLKLHNVAEVDDRLSRLERHAGFSGDQDGDGSGEAVGSGTTADSTPSGPGDDDGPGPDCVSE